MNFEDEPYVRLYTRRTVTTKLIGWEGRAVLYELLVQVDRAGVLELEGEGPAEALAALAEIPIEICRVGMARLIERGVVVIDSGRLVMPRFLEAQQSRQSDAQRQRESRARRAALLRVSQGGLRALARAEEPVTKRDSLSHDKNSPSQPEPEERQEGSVDDTNLRAVVTKRDHRASRSVTDPSHDVTRCHSSLAYLAIDPPPIIPPPCEPEDSSPEPSSEEDPDDSDAGLTPRQKAEEAEVISKIFAFWKQEHGHPKARLDRKRRSRIKARLREGFTPRELCIAIRGAKKDRFLMGENDRGVVYDGIQTLLRDAEQVERLLELEGTKRGMNGARVVSPQPKAEDWSARRARMLREHTAEELEAMGERGLALEKRLETGPPSPVTRPRIAPHPALAGVVAAPGENASAGDSGPGEAIAGG